MTEIRFFRDARGLMGVRLSGHAGFADKGEDIVCAGISSAVLLVCNGITEVLKAPCRLETGEGEVELYLEAGAGEPARAFLEALKLHLEELSREYPGYLNTDVLEV